MPVFSVLKKILIFHDNVSVDEKSISMALGKVQNWLSDNTINAKFCSKNSIMKSLSFPCKAL